MKYVFAKESRIEIEEDHFAGITITDYELADAGRGDEQTVSISWQRLPFLICALQEMAHLQSLPANAPTEA